MRGDLVIALHLIPIFISLRCGECKTANAFWQQVIMGLIFWSPLFFFSFLYRRKVGWGQGGATGVCKLHLHVPFASWNQLFETSAVEFSA